MDTILPVEINMIILSYIHPHLSTLLLLSLVSKKYRELCIAFQSTTNFWISVYNDIHNFPSSCFDYYMKLMNKQVNYNNLYSAFDRSNLELVHWLHTNHNQLLDKDLMENSLQRGHIQCINYLLSHNIALPSNCVELSVCGGLNCLLYILNLQSVQSINPQTLCQIAIINNKSDVLEYILSYYPCYNIIDDILQIIINADSVHCLYTVLKLGYQLRNSHINSILNLQSKRIRRWLFPQTIIS